MQDKEELIAQRIKIEDLMYKFGASKDDLRKAEDMLFSGGFIIDSTPVDNGKINEINEQINRLSGTLEESLEEITQKIKQIDYKLSSLNLQYRRLENEYNAM
jgi:hypothetical protein